jgi:hypothetical protein
MKKSFYTYTQKDKASDYLKTLDDNYHLFSSDKNIGGAKYFHMCSYDTIYNRIIHHKVNNYYENYNNKQPIKFYLDIDCKIDDHPKYDIHIIDKVLNVFETLFNDFTYNKYPIIILSANTDVKFSYHLIFPTIIFESNTHIKNFIKNIKSDFIKKLLDDHILDLSVYGNGCFRMFKNSKMSKKNTLVKRNLINYEYKTDKQLFMDSLLLNFDTDIKKINYIIQDDNNIPQNLKEDTHIEVKQINNTLSVVSLDELSKILNLIDVKRSDNYEEWIKIGSALKNSNQNSFNIWLEWSKKSQKFKSEYDCTYKWNSFNFKNIQVGTLKYYAKTDSPKQYSEMYKEIDGVVNFDCIKISQEYLLLDVDKKLCEKSCVVSTQIDDWVNSSIKSFIIKSSYGTGKTRLLEKIVKEYDFKRVLYVSYRKTLTNDIYGSFVNLQFEKYTDKNYTADRFICQIDSLTKIINVVDDNVPSFDLVILDEIESILNHFNATTLRDKEFIFDYLFGIIRNSNKCIMLDGDISNRAYIYIKNIGDFVFIENTFNKNPKNFIFSSNESKFDKCIDDDLKSGKKIVVVSMSSKYCIKLDDLR